MIVALLVSVALQTPASAGVSAHPGEEHLTNLRQLTFGGQNAEAYWNSDGTKIVYQSRQPEYPDEQIFVMNADGSSKALISTGKGRCTCGFFGPNGVYYSSTHAQNEGPQQALDHSKGYLWMVNPQFDLYRMLSIADASGPTGGEDRISYPLRDRPKTVLSGLGYVAETTIAPNGKFMVWTSTKDGDLEIYRSRLDGKRIKRLTNDEGYDGGPFVSWNSKKIVYRRDEIETEEERADYRNLLKQHLVRPNKLEIWIMDADGKNKRQITKLGCASFAPFLHPDNKRIIFSSNYGDPKGREFDLWMVGVDGNNLERITHSPDFDGFPMFSRDGKKLVWASNRFGKERGETNIFTAHWRD